MARLERIGDRDELVTDSGIRVPWSLGERPEYGLTLSAQPSLFDSGATAGPGAGDPEARARAAKENLDRAKRERDALPSPPTGRYNPTKEQAAQFAARNEADKKVKAAEEAEKAAFEATLPPARTGRGNATPEQAAQHEKRRLAIKAREDAQAAEARGEKPGEKKPLRAGLQEVEAPDTIGAPDDDDDDDEAAASPGRLVKGGLETDTIQITRGTSSPEELAQLQATTDRSVQSNRQSLAAQGVAEITQKDAQADELGLQAFTLQHNLAKDRGDLAKASLAADDMKADLDNDRQKLANLEADPYRYWANKGIGTKFLVAIGMLSGGLLAGVRGGENQFMKFVQEQMATDKKERMDRIKVRERGIKLREDDHDKVNAKLDKDVAQIENDSRQLASVASQIRMYAKTVQTSNAALAMKLMAEADKYDLEAQKGFAEVDSKNGDRIVETIKRQPDRVIGGAAAAKDPDEDDIRALADRLAKEGITGTSAEAGNLRDLLAKVPKKGEILTEEGRNVLSRFWRSAQDYFGGAGTAQAGDPASQRAAAQALARAKSALINRLSGANVPPEEYKRLAEGINGTNSYEGLQQYANEVERAMQRRRTVVESGFPARVVRKQKKREKRNAPAELPRSSRGE